MAICPDEVKGVIVKRQTVSVIQSNDTKKIVVNAREMMTDVFSVMIDSRPIWLSMRQSS